MDSLAAGTEEQILIAIRRIVRAIELQSQSLIARHGLTGPQLAILKEIATLGEATPTVLARALCVSQPTVSGIVERLAQRGLVVRTSATSDRRKHVVQLTAEGRSTVERAPSLLQDEVKDRLRKLEDWEQMMLLASLKRVAALMDADAVTATPFLTPGVGIAGSDLNDGAARSQDEVNEDGKR